MDLDIRIALGNVRFKEAPYRRHAALTLFELLVIIGTLAALLLPAFSNAKSRAQGAQCLNNVMPLQLAATLYGNDKRERLFQPREDCLKLALAMITRDQEMS